jgi:exodeoxyribonuclease VII large subunit
LNSYSLIELQRFIQRVLALNFDQAFWIKAEIGQASLSRGHFFLQLIQKAEDSEEIIAESRANLWSRQLKQIRSKLGASLPIEKLLQSGNEVEVLVEVQHHERFGLSLNIIDLNHEFSLGLLAKQRQETLDRLINEELLAKNKQHKLPIVVQKIAVLSSATAAGLADFKNQIKHNPYGYAFDIKLYPVAVQGQHVRKEIINALEQIQTELYKPELIIILRGGGSKLDLAAFDDFELCKATANCSIPVLAAVGHETDESVLDLVACKSVKTPTAAADFLIEKCLQFESDLNTLDKQLDFQASQILNLKLLELNKLKEGIKYGFENTIQKKKFEIEQLHLDIISKAKLSIQEKKMQLQSILFELEALNPREAIKKGFSLTTNKKGKIIRSISELTLEEQLIHHFKDGKIHSKITKITNNE